MANIEDKSIQVDYMHLSALLLLLSYGCETSIINIVWNTDLNVLFT